MKLKNNADVYTQDGEKAGEIARVVIDPDTYEITHLIVEKGFLFTENKVVPINLVSTTSEERVDLRLKEDELDQLHNLVETQFIPADTTRAYRQSIRDIPHPIYWYPPSGTVWWTQGGYPGYAIPPYVARREQQIPEGMVALEEGAKVISRDGEHIGDVEQVLTDPETNYATHLVIAEGFLLKEHKMVPTLWIKEVQADEIRLSISADLFEQVPTYEEA